MKTIQTSEGECLQYLEKCEDGGLVIGTLVPAGDGEYVVHRHWYQEPSLARKVYNDEKPEDVLNRVVSAKNVTGRLVETEI